MGAVGPQLYPQAGIPEHTRNRFIEQTMNPQLFSTIWHEIPILGMKTPSIPEKLELSTGL
jgi:hypothetical protein